MTRTIGAISDTHGLLRPQALAALAGCDPIIHAGDVGSPDVLARLAALALVHAVRGNVDHGTWSAKLPVTPHVTQAGILYDPEQPTSPAYLKTIEATAPSFKVQILPDAIRDAEAIERAIATLASGTNGGLIVLPGALMIGLLDPRSSSDTPVDILRAFRQDLREAGYVEGENITTEYRWADNQIDRLPALASDLVRQPVAVIAATGSAPRPWPLELGDCGRAPPDGLADLEVFELRMVDVERLVLARIPVGGAEFG
jgi:hypothetical protein